MVFNGGDKIVLTYWFPFVVMCIFPFEIFLTFWYPILVVQSKFFFYIGSDFFLQILADSWKRHESSETLEEPLNFCSRLCNSCKNLAKNNLSAKIFKDW